MTTLHGMALFDFTLYGMAWHCIAVHGIWWLYTAWHDFTWYDTTLLDFTLHDMALHCLILHGMTWLWIAWHDITWLHIAWHDMTWHDMTWRQWIRSRLWGRSKHLNRVSHRSTLPCSLLHLFVFKVSAFLCEKNTVRQSRSTGGLDNSSLPCHPLTLNLLQFKAICLDGWLRKQEFIFQSQSSAL